MDLKQSDMGLLLALDALLDERGVTAAAKRLNISQPAMSAQLGRLRRLFNDPLLVPSGRRMVATTRALELHDPLRRLLRDLDMLVSSHVAFDPATTEAVFRLGGTDFVHSVLAVPFVRRVRAAAPNVKFSIHPIDPSSLWRNLEDGTLDAAVATTLIVLNEAKSRFLFSESFAFVQRKGHPRGTDAPDLESFCALDHVLVSTKVGGFVGAVDTALKAIGWSRNVVASVPSFLLASTLIGATDLVCVLPKRFALSFPDILDVFDLPLEVPGFDSQLVWHPKYQNDPAHIWFRNQIVDLVKGGGT